MSLLAWLVLRSTASVQMPPQPPTLFPSHAAAIVGRSVFPQGTPFTLISNRIERRGISANNSIQVGFAHPPSFKMCLFRCAVRPTTQIPFCLWILRFGYGCLFVASGASFDGRLDSEGKAKKAGHLRLPQRGHFQKEAPPKHPRDY